VTTAITIAGFDLHVTGAGPADAGITSELLAEKLGYSHRGKLEELARRHAEYLSKFGQIPTVVIRVQAPGQVAPRLVDIPVFNRNQALYLVLKSEQPTANDLSIRLIDAFNQLEELIRRRSAVPELADFTRAVESLVGMVTSMGKRLEAVEGAVVSPSRGADLRRRMLSLARLRVEAGFDAAQPSALRVVQNKVGSAVGHLGKGCSWDRLPAAKFPEAMRVIEELEADAKRALKIKRDEGQGSLPFGKVH
jgi:hypothetical protein